ncbi:hypothetical protein IWW39_000243 [Coemansia spiralis]|uniref:BHLH domain-containing protein n=1 Tax=Coemansia spiralis TaxID=417178 RepID=A0A9W8GL29_9FUNG|nr:hypothetical protein IWW39_000243 [Coemansia spiralis]
MSASSKAIGAKTSASTPSLQPRPGSSSDVDSEVQSNKPLFLNFTAELAPFGASSKKQKTKKSNVYKVSGVNILNRNSVDSKTALERLQRRRENHNFVERRRRDNINHTITTLSSLIPYCAEEGVKLNKGSILHMAVEYIRDMQDINSALSEENIRLGGSGSMELPSHRPNRRDSSVISELNTAVHSEEEDDEEDGEEQDDDDESTLPLMMCSSASTASTQSPQRRSRKGSVGQASAPNRKRSNSKSVQAAAEARRGGAAGACKRPMLSISPPSSSTSATPMSSRTNLSLSAAGHYHHGQLPMCMASPPLTTANTSTAPSANTSPMGMNSATVSVSFASTGARSVPSAANLSHLPPPLMAKPSQQQLPPMMPSLSSMTANDTSSLANRQPAQSMPSSPNFRHAPAIQVAQPLMGVLRNTPGSSASSISSHPFFNTDVSSVRHNLQPPSDRHVHPVYGSTTAPHSLQSTPMMRPDPTLSDKFELPPLAFNDGSTAPYLSRMH